MPAISILLPVYNSEQYVYDSVQSILNQSFGDFELFVLDDCSTDNSLKIVERFNDERIKVFKSKKNEGYVFQLNKGLSIAKGKYIARMDSDDIANETRFQLQYEFLENNLDYVFCGTAINIFFDEKSPVQAWNNFVVVGDDEKIRTELLFRNPVCHPTVMIRAETLVSNNVQYKLDYITAEDYKMWCDLSQYGKMYNLDKVLLNYRIQPNQVSQKKLELQTMQVNRIREEFRKKFLFESTKNPQFYQAFEYLLTQFDIERNKLSSKQPILITLCKKVMKHLS